MRVVLVGAVLLLVACPGRSPPRTADRTEPAEATEPHEEGVRALTPPIPPPQMVEQMIGQLVLDHPRVTPYLHPGAEPLAIFPVPELARGAPALEAGGRPVRVVASEGEARFIFRAYERRGTTAELRIRFAIPAEGVSGYVDVELRDNVWRATGANVTEQ